MPQAYLLRVVQPRLPEPRGTGSAWFSAGAAPAVWLTWACCGSVKAQLARYSLAPEAYAAWRAGVGQAMAAGRGKAVPIAEIRVEGLVRTNPNIVRRLIRSRVGQPIDEAQVVADAQRIFARGDYEKVDYNVTDSENGRVLEFLPLEKPWGPDYLRFDLGLMSSAAGDTGFVLRADYARTWINALGARWNNTLQLGRTALLETSLFQPLDLRQRFFVEPGLRFSREQQDLYRGEDRVARYERTLREASLAMGEAFGTWGELRVGLRRAQGDYLAKTGTVLLPELRNVVIGGFTSRFTFDTRDSPFIPTHGAYVHVDLYAATAALGSQDSYHRAQLFAQTARRLGAVGRIAYLRKLTDLQTLLGQALYAGATLEAGNMYDRIDRASARGVILGSSVFFAGRTPLGPLLLSLGYAEGGHTAFFLQIGRPLVER